eukprot:jgi/Orpsp1_1/1184118/evm.model.c7180000088095.1
MKLVDLIGLVSLIKLASASCGQAYFQCGGSNFTGEKCCVSGYKCQYVNEYFSQCLPGSSNEPTAPVNNAVNVPKPTSTTYNVSASTTPFPAAKKTVTFNEPYVIKAGQVYDGLAINGVWTSYGRGVTGQGDCKNIEGLTSDAVFVLETGATLKNVILGPDAIEHVHCIGDSCTVQNVWWDDVCEDALSILGSSNQKAEFHLIGGGARDGSDKIVQHNSAGTVYIKGFTVLNSGKLYRSCGNCIEGYQNVRHAVIEDVTATGVKVIAGINTNYGDTVTFKNVKSDNGKLCWTFIGNNNDSEPVKTGLQCKDKTDCVCK